MSNFKKLFILWLFIAMVAFLSCSNNGGAVDPPQDGGSGDTDVPKDNESYEIIINLNRFIKITGLGDPNNLLEQTPPPWSYADEYRIGDTMAIWCNITIRKSNGIWSTYDVRRDGPLPPIITKVTSSKTGDVQYITFVPFPFWVYIQIITGWHIAYISPVKTELNQMLPDPTREELNISPDGDILTVEIMYEDQFLTATINVKGD